MDELKPADIPHNTMETRQSGEIANTSVVMASPLSEEKQKDFLLDKANISRSEMPTIEQDHRRVGSRKDQLRAFDLLLSNDFDNNPSTQMLKLQHQQQKMRTSRQF